MGEMDTQIENLKCETYSKYDISYLLTSWCHNPPKPSTYHVGDDFNKTILFYALNTYWKWALIFKHLVCQKWVVSFKHSVKNRRLLEINNERGRLIEKIRQVPH